jgi:S-formylglutathione hydrolase
MQRVSSSRSFGGRQEVWEHDAATIGARMRFGVYLPPQAETERCPVLYFLSGLTCTEQNVVTKGGFQEPCAKHGIILVAPDTSPRGDGVPDDAAYDLGQGAGFYVNATEAPWDRHFRMYDYVRDELPAQIDAAFPTTGRRGVTGHSMGGHGALILALREPDRYHSVSAFAPIAAPSEVPWGEKAFSAYLGPDRARWAAWDAAALVAGARVRRPILVDQGTDDGFLATQLRPERLEAACAAAGHPLELRRQAGYDHSYFFISTFAADHVAHHARALR